MVARATRTDLAGTVAPEFPRGLKWLNAASPLSLRGLAGKPVLIEFWTYSCVNCLRVLPYLKRWHEKYSKLGLVVIGVHTPEFSFEKEPGRVGEAIVKLGITFPVVLDNDYRVWNQYANAWWPRKLIVNTKGEIVYDHIGEGAYLETESRIREIFRKELRLPEDSLPPAEEIPEVESAGICYQATPETYLGYGRGRIGTNDLVKDVQARYTDPRISESNQWYLSGNWIARSEFVEHAIQEDGAYIRLRFSAFSVNCVMGSRQAPGLEIVVMLNGRPPEEKLRGYDVSTLENGTSVILVREHRMYNIISSPEFLEGGDIKLFVREPGLRLFVFTFGGCEPRVLKEASWQR